MKRFIILVMALVLAFSLVACVAPTPTPCQHVDVNSDGKCDKCSAAVEVKQPCTEHVDSNGDQKCDNCSADVPKEEPEHTECVDENKDGICDNENCKKPVEPEDTPGGNEDCNHKDEDGDALCDNCGAVFTPIIPLPFG